MLAEAESRDPAQFHEDRPIKRRRMGHIRAISLDSSLPKDPDEMSHNGSTQQIQTVYDSGSSDESDVEWEDVDIPQPVPGPSSASLAVQENDETLEITLGQEPQPRQKVNPKRKPITAAEKKIRLDVHKSHLLCLLGHVSLRNRWCNDDEIHVCDCLLV
jgi:xeroderma pigmentosum group C-complementing protein